MEPVDFDERLATAVDVGEISEALFDEIADRRAAAEKALTAHFNALGSRTLSESLRRVLEG